MNKAHSLRVLHVIGGLSPRAGGPTNIMMPMCQALVDRGHRVEIMCTNVDWPRGAIDVLTGRPVAHGDVQVTYYPFQWHRYSLSLQLATALRRRIPTFDVVHVHSLYLFHTLVAARICQECNVPYVLRPHGTLDPYQRRRNRYLKAVYEWLFERRNLRRASAIHYMTDEEKRRSEIEPGLAPGAVVPHGVDLSELATPVDDQGFWCQYPELRNRRLVAFLGRITPKKGLDLLARAWPAIARVRPDAHLVIAGPDDEGLGPRVVEMLRNAGVLDRVTFTGMLQGARKVTLLQHASVFVLPSYFENFGVAAVEAMACGAPVVLSDQVYVYREVQEAGAGIVIPCRAEDLAAAILRLLDNPEEAHRMAERGRALVETQFTWDAVARRLEGLYLNVTGRSSAPAVSPPGG